MQKLFIGSAQPMICSETSLLSGTRIKQTQSTSKMYFLPLRPCSLHQMRSVQNALHPAVLFFQNWKFSPLHGLNFFLSLDVFSGKRIDLTTPWKRNIHIATFHCGVSVQLASGNRWSPTGVVDAYQTKIRQVAGSIGSVHSTHHVGSSCSLVDCRLHVDVGSVVGNTLECGIVDLCAVAAGGDKVVGVDCSWRIGQACELWCWSNVRRKTAGTVGVTALRTRTSAGS